MQAPGDPFSPPPAARLSRRAALGGIGGIAAAVVGLTGSAEAKDKDKPGKKEGPFPLGPSVDPLARSGSAATLLPTGLVLVTGGFQSSVLSSAQVYDPDADRWFDVAPMNTPRSNHAAVALHGRLVVVLGGQSTHALASVEVYDPREDTWTLAEPLSRPRFGHAAVLIHHESILVTGGFHLAPLSTVEIYDVRTGMER